MPVHFCFFVFCVFLSFPHVYGREKDSGGGGSCGGGAAELGSSVTLTDSVGQRIEVLLENRLGEGGQRHVVVYCPVWMVNTSRYCLRYSSLWLVSIGLKCTVAGNVYR